MNYENLSPETREFIDAYKNATPEAQAVARKMLEATAPVDPVDDETDDLRRITLAYWGDAVKCLDDEQKKEALILCRLWYGATPAENSPAHMLMLGFLMGMGAGLQFADDSSKAE